MKGNNIGFIPWPRNLEIAYGHTNRHSGLVMGIVSNMVHYKTILLWYYCTFKGYVNNKILKLLPR